MKNFLGSGKLTLREWWPNLLHLKMLNQNPPELNPFFRTWCTLLGHQLQLMPSSKKGTFSL